MCCHSTYQWCVDFKEVDKAESVGGEMTLKGEEIKRVAERKKER